MKGNLPGIRYGRGISGSLNLKYKKARYCMIKATLQINNQSITEKLRNYFLSFFWIKNSLSQQCSLKNDNLNIIWSIWTRTWNDNNVHIVTMDAVIIMATQGVPHFECRCIHAAPSQKKQKNHQFCILCVCFSEMWIEIKLREPSIWGSAQATSAWLVVSK